jgi:hypothetical protein
LADFLCERGFHVNVVRTGCSGNGSHTDTIVEALEVSFHPDASNTMLFAFGGA